MRAAQFATRLVAPLLVITAGGASTPTQAAPPDLAKPELTVVSQPGVQQALALEYDLGRAAQAAAVVSAIGQNGNGNHATVTQSGRALSLNIEQNGSNNSVVATQAGPFSTLDVSQQGNGNKAVFNQSGAVRATLVQNGDLHKADINQSAAAPNIVIRQSGTATVVQTTQY
jgi:hypothetical protein